jgi:hypothetical protein
MDREHGRIAVRTQRKIAVARKERQRTVFDEADMMSCANPFHFGHRSWKAQEVGKIDGSSPGGYQPSYFVRIDVHLLVDGIEPGLHARFPKGSQLNAAAVGWK